MSADDLYFVIPTYRLRDVGETVEQYDEHFRRNGHAPKLIVCDDSSPAAQEKYYPLLEQTTTHSDLYYVGPREKEQFTGYLSRRLRDKRLDGLVKNLFRPSYVGNRNFTLMCTLGGLMVSSDDDMRPYALAERARVARRGRDQPRPAAPGRRLHQEVVRHRRRVPGRARQAGRRPAGQLRERRLPERHRDGTGDQRLDRPVAPGELSAARGRPGAGGRGRQDRPDVRTGANDIDALDFAEMFLGNDDQIDPDELNEFYVLTNFRPATTKQNSRMDCGVAGYDNQFVLPPFFPTRLRFEDYIYRLWVRQPGVAASHVPAAQNHTKSNCMRNPVAVEIFNEGVCNLLKRKIKDSVSRVDELGVAFDYDGEVTADEAKAILEKVAAMYARALEASGRAAVPERAAALRQFAANLQKAFYAFEPDFFKQNLLRIVDDVVSIIKGSIELWPTLVEIGYFEKSRRGLPQVKVGDRRKH